MKKSILLLVLLSFFLFSSSEIFAENSRDIKKKEVVNNLVKGITSENQGLRVSAALKFSELIDANYINKNDAETAVIPLMHMLRKGNTEIERIAAALSLYRIKDGRGIYLLRGSAKFDSSDKVRKVNKNLYYNFHRMNGTEYLIDF